MTVSFLQWEFLYYTGKTANLHWITALMISCGCGIWSFQGINQRRWCLVHPGQKRGNSRMPPMELCPFCVYPSIWCMYWWLSARLQYLQCISNGDTGVLHWAIGMSLQSNSINYMDTPASWIMDHPYWMADTHFRASFPRISIFIVNIKISQTSSSSKSSTGTCFTNIYEHITEIS